MALYLQHSVYFSISRILGCNLVTCFYWLKKACLVYVLFLTFFFYQCLWLCVDLCSRGSFWLIRKWFSLYSAHPAVVGWGCCPNVKGGLWTQLLCTGTWPVACRHTHVTISSFNLMNASRWTHRDPKSFSDKHMREMANVGKNRTSILSRHILSALFNSDWCVCVIWSIAKLLVWAV